ncbi:MAG: roadblock/LC7 domain-containing protein [Gemmatimonadales bacterium]|jgi:predicted regulator of Ras-like GTPase activity (Roadblock/LC7/MglB family)
MERLEIKQIQAAFDEPLREFVRESAVRLAVLINRSGQVLAQHGFDKVFDLVGVASLAAGINASSRALANQLGEEQFEHLHHAGRARQLFLGHFDSAAGQLMLVAVFDDRSSIGLVRLFFEQFVGGIRRLPSMDASRTSVNAAEFEAELETSLDKFFQDLIGG